MSQLWEREPGRTIVEHMQSLALKLADRTGRQGITRMCVDKDFGPLLGLAPGQTAIVHTAAGSVELYCEPHSRHRDL